MRQREGKPGGGKGPLMSEDKSLTIATANDQILFITQGVWSVREDAKANTFSATPADTALTVNAHQPSVQSHHAQLFIAQEQPMEQPIAFSHTQGLDAQPSETASPTLKTEGNGMAAAYDEYNDSIADTHHTLRAGTKQSTGVVTTIVRRLTPTECERLQGFPDNWTAQRIDHKTGNVIEQKDSARYKQMGNAVAVPCVEWIINRLIETDINV